MYPLFETIKIIDGIAQNLDWHQSRYEFACNRMYGKKSEIIIADSLSIPEKYSTGKIKLRFSYNENSFSLDFSCYIPKKIQSLKLVEDSKIDYSLKYSDRKAIDNLFQMRGECDDILIVKETRITDCSFANVVFYNGTDWETPNSPLLKGTCRERLLSEKKIIEKGITVNDLPGYTELKLINAMMDIEDQEALDISAIKK